MLNNLTQHLLVLADEARALFDTSETVVTSRVQSHPQHEVITREGLVLRVDTVVTRWRGARLANVVVIGGAPDGQRTLHESYRRGRGMPAWLQDLIAEDAPRR